MNTPITKLARRLCAIKATPMPARWALAAAQGEPVSNAQIRALPDVVKKLQDEAHAVATVGEALGQVPVDQHHDYTGLL